MFNKSCERLLKHRKCSFEYRNGSWSLEEGEKLNIVLLARALLPVIISFFMW